MRRIALGIAALMLVSPMASAQQRTWGDIIGENYMRGRHIREAADERRRSAEARRQEQITSEFDAARRNPSFIIKSKNGLPDIIVSEQAVSACATEPSWPAFTRDATGDIVNGCVIELRDDLQIFWIGYGTRYYNLLEWEAREQSDADHVPLGSN